MKSSRTSARAQALLFPPPPRDGVAWHPRVLAGIDEAGYGPLLGPLTIGATALRSPRGPVDPWKLLRPLVGRARARKPPPVAVDDSKVVFARDAAGRARLERTALCFHAQVHGAAGDARAFLAATPVALRSSVLEAEPWFGALGRRLEAEADDVDEVARALAEALRGCELEVASCAVRAVPPGELNASIARTGSKGATHWDQCAPLLVDLWQRFGAEGLDLVVDRHGGRMRYGALLRRTLPRAAVETVSEEPARSIYALEDGDGRTARVVFAEKADGASFAVALASCLAKYARELCMDAFNAHYGALQPGLRPTAGYLNDARRWLREAGPALERAGRPAESVVRAR